MIEERSSFAGKSCNCLRQQRRSAFSGGPLARDADGGFILPFTARGRLLLEVNGFFES